MLARSIKILLIIAGILVLVAGLLGYWFYNSGEDYGQERQVANQATLRTTELGKVVGFIDKNQSHTWMGIPYAQPPEGDLRWRAPLPPTPWQGTLEALQAGDFCKQLGSQMESRPPKEWGKPIGSEDCLSLNIFAPAFAADSIPGGEAQLPVMVYVHGGGNMVGYANQYKYSGRHLARTHNVIVVSFNYRLGPFGWFSHPVLNKDGSAEDRSGNYGNLDTIRALQWVQNNIAAFGGNPNKVTVFGESAGGMNTYVLLASPLAKDLFQQAIIQSGISSATTAQSRAQNYRTHSEQGSPNSSREVVNRFLIADGLASDASSATQYQDSMGEQELADYLRGKSADEVLAIYPSDGPLGLADVPALFADGTVIPARPLMEVYSNISDYNAVPVIIGSNRDEFKMLAMMDEALVTQKYGVLPRVKDKPYFEAYTSYLNDFIKANGVDEIAVTLSQSQGDSVYAYRFDWDELPTIAGTDMAEMFGAAHAAEIPFVFGMFDDTFMNNLFFDDDNIPGRDSLSASMSSYWAELAYSGTPGRGRNGTDPEWKPWRNAPANSEKYILFDDASDGGIQMSRDAITMSVLHQRLLKDTRFPDRATHSQMYDCLLKETPYWDAEEFEKLGGQRLPEPDV